MKRAAVLGLVLWSALQAGAFDLQYGELFVVSGITVENSRPVLPLTRGKYANARVLDKETFALLKTCPALCRQESKGGQWQVSQLRPAKTRADMWIAEVSVDGAWLLTFLIFKNKDGFRLVSPEPVRVLDASWLLRVEQGLTKQVSAQQE